MILKELTTALLVRDTISAVVPQVESIINIRMYDKVG